MKNFLLFLMMMFMMDLNIFAQSTTETDQMQKDIAYLRTLNTKLKMQVNKQTAEQNQSITEIKGIVSSTDQNVRSSANSLNQINDKINFNQANTQKRFNRYRTVIKTSIIAGSLSLIAIVIGLLYLIYNLKKKIKLNYDALQADLNKQKETFIVQLNITNESFEKKSNEIIKQLNTEILGLSNAIENKIKQNMETINTSLTNLKADADEKNTAIKVTINNSITDLKKEILTIITNQQTEINTKINDLNNKLSTHNHIES